jgi:hypothetical protein
MFLHNLLNVLVHIANKMGLQKDVIMEDQHWPLPGCIAIVLVSISWSAR